MIEIVSKENFVNFATFKPKLKVTLLLDVEAMQDQKAIDPNFYQEFGKEFESVIKKDTVK